MSQHMPVYRILLKNPAECLPTCVVAGPHRRRTWLYVHAATPTVLPLHPPVVTFLRGVLDELVEAPEGRRSRWSLRKDTHLSHPGCVVLPHGGEVWLHLLGATPSTLRLSPLVVGFLREALSDLPGLPQVSRAR